MVVLSTTLMAQTVSSAYVRFRLCSPTSSVLDTTVGCGIPFLWHGQTIQTAGTYYATLIGGNALGCDSTITMHLTVQNWSSPTITIQDTLCRGGEFFWNGKYYDEPGVYQRHLTNIYGCDSIVRLELAETVCAPEGAIKGLFTVYPNRHVYFSKGNLQYRASEDGSGSDLKYTGADGKTYYGKWRFATHQYDYVGGPDSYTGTITQYGNVYEMMGGSIAQCSNIEAASTYTGWIDAFAFGTSGYGSKFPYLKTKGTTSSDYIDKDLVEDYRFYDWGVFNPISNGGNQPELWRTMTVDEWDYIINKRANAKNLRGYATVNGVKGTVLLPDDWSTSGVSFSNGATYTKNTWAPLEEKGAVFLPWAGYRNNASNNFYIYTVQSSGYYWTANYKGSMSPAYTYHATSSFSSSDLPNELWRAYGASVRLVQDAE